MTKVIRLYQLGGEVGGAKRLVEVLRQIVSSRSSPSFDAIAE